MFHYPRLIAVLASLLLIVMYVDQIQAHQRTNSIAPIVDIRAARELMSSMLASTAGLILIIIVRKNQRDINVNALLVSWYVIPLICIFRVIVCL